MSLATRCVRWSLRLTIRSGRHEADPDEINRRKNRRQIYTAEYYIIYLYFSARNHASSWFTKGTHEMRLISKIESASRTGYHPESWMRLVRAGLAPQPVRHSSNKISFVESEIEEWIRAKISERDAELEAAEESEKRVIERDAARDDHEDEAEPEEVVA